MKVSEARKHLEFLRTEAQRLRAEGLNKPAGMRSKEAEALDEKLKAADLRYQMGESVETIDHDPNDPAWADKKPRKPKAVPNPPSELEAWRGRLRSNSRGELAGTLSNATLALTYCREWKDVFAYDEFQSCIVVRSAMPTTPDYQNPTHATFPANMDDSDPKRVAIWLERQMGIGVTPGVAYDAIEVVAKAHTFNPVRDRIAALVWDKVPRLGSWLTSYLGVARNDYSQSVGYWWLVSAVARVFKPGCKVDHTLILEGPQHAGKSTVAKTLSLGWFNDSKIDLSSKDGYISLRGSLVVELAELDAFNRQEASSIKQFLTSTHDIYRPPYGRDLVRAPRQCVFIGTVNLSQYLRDETGGRRFWPVEVGTIDKAALAQDVEQLWAEARVAYESGVPWYPITDAEHELCEAEQAQRQIEDPWVETIERWLAKQRRESVTWNGWVSVPEVLSGALEMRPERHDQFAHSRAGRALRTLKFRQKKMPARLDPKRNLRWRDPEATGADD